MLTDKRFDLSYLQIWSFKIIYHIFKQKHVKSEKYRTHRKIDYLVEYEDHTIKTIKIWLSDFRKIIIKQDVEIVKLKSDQKYNDEDSTENFYDENDEISIWDFINSSNQIVIIKKKKRFILLIMNILKIVDVKQLADSFLLKKQKKLLQHLQEVCDINITDSQHLFSEKKSDIVQKQNTESTEFTRSIKQSC